MATTAVAIYNMALSHLANSTEVQDTTENTSEANACRRFYEQSVEEVLESLPWPFSKKRAALALVAEDPTPEWTYSYRYPTDCITALRIVSALYSVRNPGPGQIVPYQIVKDATGRLILCDIETAYLEYTERVTDETLYSATFAQAVSLRLASYIAPRVTGGDPYQLGRRALQFYYAAIATATASALNEIQPDELPDAEWITDRE